MAQETKELSSVEEETDWRPRVLAIGGVVGAIVGVISAFLYIRSAEESYGEVQPTPPKTSDAVGVGVALLSIVRTVTDWGRR